MLGRLARPANTAGLQGKYAGQAREASDHGRLVGEVRGAGFWCADVHLASSLIMPEKGVAEVLETEGAFHATCTCLSPIPTYIHAHLSPYLAHSARRRRVPLPPPLLRPITLVSPHCTEPAPVAATAAEPAAHRPCAGAGTALRCLSGTWRSTGSMLTCRATSGNQAS